MYFNLILIFIQMETIFLKISSSDRFKRQRECAFQPVWSPVNETVDVFKDFYFNNFKKKQAKLYNISNKFEMETRFQFKTPCGTMEYDPAAAIVGGMDAPDKAWPWQAKVLSRDFNCGGVLIDANWIMTAAHCVESNELYTIRLGTRFRVAGNNDVIRTSQIKILHDEYNRNTLENDVALIKLSSHVDFTDRVRPACLPVYGQDFYLNDFCYITGFGDRRRGVPVNILQQLKVYVVQDKECFYLFRALSLIIYDRRTFCVGKVIQRGGACFGDSGGPLSCKIGNKFYVAGIASFLTENCNSDYVPDGYSRVTEYMNWILSVIEKHK